MARVETAELEAGARKELREFLDEAYGGRFADEDWEHALGGQHFVVRSEDGLTAHAALVERQLLHGEWLLRTGYVEALAVRGDHRRRGLAKAVLESVEQVIRETYDLGALSDGTGIHDFYEHRGWIRWAGATWVASSTGLRRTREDDGGVYVLRTRLTLDLDPSGALACDWRAGDVW